jgi:hypothetical protein
MTTAAVFGCTGAVGGQILNTLLNSDAFISVKTISRRLPPTSESSKLDAIQEPDTTKWGDLTSTLTPKPTTVFNAVGTTRTAAGSIANQWKIDHDLCVANAQAARAAGVTTYVYISSAGTRGMLAGRAPYSRMKVGVEDAIRDLGFEHAVVLRPGMILGERKTPKAPFLEKVVAGLYVISPGLRDSLGIKFYPFSFSFSFLFCLPACLPVCLPVPVCLIRKFLGMCGTDESSILQVRTRRSLAGPRWRLRVWRRRARRPPSSGCSSRLISSSMVETSGRSDWG